jgi:hypothetical protein
MIRLRSRAARLDIVRSRAARLDIVRSRAARLAIVCFALLRAPLAEASPDADAEALSLVDDAINTDYLGANLDAAEAKLERALALCADGACKPTTSAKVEVEVALGTVHGLGRRDYTRAKDDFAHARAHDSHAALIDGLTSPELVQAFGSSTPRAPSPVDPPSDAPSAAAPSTAEDSSGTPIAKKLSFEVSAYTDDTATEVLSPYARFELSNGVAGWGIGASVMIDVVTSASTDIVATASPKWTDIRTAPELDGRFKVGDATISLGAGASIETDFIAANGSAGLAIDFARKTITPSLTYSYGYNLGGRRGTSYDVYQRLMQSHTIQSAVTFVLDKATILVPTFTLSLEFGDSAKPYRWLPTFRPGTDLLPGESVSSVNKKRTDFEVEERLPEERQRYAVSGLLAHRFTSTTLRLDERLYADSWDLYASTTDFMLPIDVGSVLRLWPHLRFNIQSGVSFWQLGYTAKPSAAGLAVTGLRTGDRELGPLLGLTMGGGVRINASDAIGIGFAADAVYTNFFDALYVTERWSALGALTFDAEF